MSKKNKKKYYVYSLMLLGDDGFSSRAFKSSQPYITTELLDEIYSLLRMDQILINLVYMGDYVD